MWPKLEVITIRLEVIDVFRQRDMVRGIEGEPKVGECGQLLRADELGVFIGAVMKSASNMLFPGSKLSVQIGSGSKEAYASKCLASIGFSRVEFSIKVFKVARPPGQRRRRQL